MAEFAVWDLDFGFFVEQNHLCAVLRVREFDAFWNLSGFVSCALGVCEKGTRVQGLSSHKLTWNLLSPL